MFRIDNGAINISVRCLVEFLFCSGDIDNRFSGVSEIEAMQAGAKIHKKIQKKMGSGYRAEVPLKIEVPMEHYVVVLDGRADGIFTQDDMVVIDEIKGMYADVMKLEEPYPVHLAQAKCYAYIYAKEKNLPFIMVRMTYVDLDTEFVQILEETYSFEDLQEWFEKTMALFGIWADFLEQSNQLRNQSIHSVHFPFDYRPGQKELAVSVYKTIQRQKSLFIQAPTGVGKTISTIFPAVKAIGEGLCDKLFYLTAKTITRTVAQNTFEELRRQSLLFRTVTLTAKEKICECGLQCNPIDCEYAKGHYDRINDAVYDIVTHEYDITRDTIVEYAKKHKVCPFEFGLDISYWCDGIICDYNYVFDPNAHLRRYFSDGIKGDYVFLIDEAHNLVERGREMYSATLSKNSVMEFRRIIKNYSKRLYQAADRINKEMLEIKRSITKDYLVMESIDILLMQLMYLMDELIRFNDTHRNFEYKEEVTAFFFEVRDFLNISELTDSKYVIYAQILDNDDVIVRQFCVDPSTNLKMCMDKGNASILFSATLLPIQYYKKILRDCEEDYAIYAHSPFDSDKRKVLMAQDVTTKYTERNRTQFQKIYQYICRTAGARTGNYMVFFPSYRYLQDVLEFYREEDFELIVQDTNMTEEEKELFLNQFEENHTKKSFVGFCVMGGIFSEGIDLKEESLIGAVIVGNGLPQIGSERQILQEQFGKSGLGFEYAYLYPGLNKVLQSAGRVIRTEKDKGVIVLLDYRFLNGSYEGLIPAEWTNLEVTNLSVISSQLKKFWE